MAKTKTHKATAKRCSITKGGKVKFNHINRRHKLGKMTSKRKRQLRCNAYISDSFTPIVKKLMPYA